MDIQKKVDLLNHRLDKLDNDYSCTLAQIMTDVHSLKDSEKERKDISNSDKNRVLDFCCFALKAFAISLSSVFAISIILRTVHDLFF